jgi:hypothetical protein
VEDTALMDAAAVVTHTSAEVGRREGVVLGMVVDTGIPLPNLPNLPLGSVV